MNLDAERQQLFGLAGEWLRYSEEATTDYDGSAMAEREQPRIVPSCRDLRAVSSLLERYVDHVAALVRAQYAELRRTEAETIERCAKVCDALESEFIKKDAELGDEDDARWVYMATGVRASIKAIRALGKGS